jgi:hypothetical protein
MDSFVPLSYDSIVDSNMIPSDVFTFGYKYKIG